MTICEIFNERNELTRIEFHADNKVEVIKSHGYSLMFMLKYKQIQNWLKVDQDYHGKDLHQKALGRTYNWLYANYERKK